MIFEFETTKRPVVLSWSYVQRTWKIESPGEGVLTCSANEMESIGIKDAIKKAFHPINDIELGTVNADGDAKARNIQLRATIKVLPHLKN